MRTSSVYSITTLLFVASALILGLGENPPCEKLDGVPVWICAGCTTAPEFGTCGCVINELTDEGTCQSTTSPITRCQKKEGIIPAVSGSIVVIESGNCYKTYECKSTGPSADCNGFGCVFKVTGEGPAADLPVQYDSSTCDGQT